MTDETSNELVGSQFIVQPPSGMSDLFGTVHSADGDSVTISFTGDSVENLVLFISDLDATYSISAPFAVANLPGTTLGVNASGELFSSVFDANDPSTENQGTGTLEFSGPVSSVTITKVSGPADEFSFGFATITPGDLDADGDSIVD